MDNVAIMQLSRTIWRDAYQLLLLGMAAFGIGVLIFAGLFWFNRQELAAWYQQLPVVIAKCQGAK